jgi:hypothetical protein
MAESRLFDPKKIFCGGESFISVTESIFCGTEKIFSKAD